MDEVFLHSSNSLPRAIDQNLELVILGRVQSGAGLVLVRTKSYHPNTQKGILIASMESKGPLPVNDFSSIKSCSIGRHIN